MKHTTLTRSSESARFVAVAVLAGAALAAAAGPAAAQKRPWTITNVEVSEKALTGRADGNRQEEVTEFDGEGKPKKVFLSVTITFEKAPTVNTVRAAQVLNKKKKAAGTLFAVLPDPLDKKIVTLVFRSPMAWEAVEEMQLKMSNTTAPVKKADNPAKP